MSYETFAGKYLLCRCNDFLYSTGRQDGFIGRVEGEG